MKKLLIPLSFILLLSSCAVHQGMISSSSLNRPVKYNDMAYGVSQTNQILGLGGLSKDALILEAKKELINNRPLKQNETYANFTVDFKRSFFPFYSQVKATMSADVVSFTDDLQSDPYSEQYKSKLAHKSLVNKLFEIGDSVYLDHHKQGVIISIEDIDRVRVLFKTKNGNTKTKILSVKKIYTCEKSYKGYKAGDMYLFTSNIKGNMVETSARIILLGMKEIIVRTGTGKLKRFEYKN